MAIKRRPCSKCQKNRQEKFFDTPRARVCNPCQKKTRCDYSRDQRLRETYGITLEEYEEMFKAQDGRCAICFGTRRQNLDVDHCHKTGQVRGLLCRRCNRRLLPAAQDRIEILGSATAYLMEPPALRVLGERLVPGTRSD